MMRVLSSNFWMKLIFVRADRFIVLLGSDTFAIPYKLEGVFFISSYIRFEIRFI